ncbi:ArsR/SmtB family transcription factor [Brachybacterium tyrofermentans]|uniref:ArsR/SmtB family transcription factor n=1 Tax=Brachybacterium tyrofermentans TaxID=47848 RepID=UPI003FD5683C
MHALDVLGDPVRRRILELLAEGELGAGEIGESVQQEFGISQPAVSQHLRVLREHGFATVRAEGRRRLYAVDARGPQEARDWLTPFERFWLPALDALGTELARGRRQRRLAADATPSADGGRASSADDGSAPQAGVGTSRTSTVPASTTPASSGSAPTDTAPGIRPVAAHSPKES